MIKLKIEGEPEEIAAFLFHLEECAGIEVKYKTPVSKWEEHRKWGSALAGIQAELVEGLEPVVTIYEGRRGKSGGKSNSKSSSTGAAANDTAATAGYVYLVPFYGPAGTDGYKIGKTVKPQSRRSTFGVKFNFRVDFIALIHSPNHSALETQLHRQFADRRTGYNEFFTLTLDDVATIQGMMSEADKTVLAELNARWEKKSDG